MLYYWLESGVEQWRCCRAAFVTVKDRGGTQSGLSLDHRRVLSPVGYPETSYALKMFCVVCHEDKIMC
jgi:hypothetical protein